MFGKLVRSKSGFSLLEIIITLAIVALLAAIAVPNLKMRQAGYERKQFIDHLNALLQLGWQNAVVTSKLHKVVFDLKSNSVSIQIQTNKKDSTGNLQFNPIASNYLKSTYNWPKEVFEFKNFYVNKRDELQMTLKEGLGKIWFFIVPDDMIQPVIINILDTKQIPAGTKGVEFSLILNPFTAQFKEYDQFQKP